MTLAKPLRLLPEDETIDKISKALLRLATLYQIPNFSAPNALILAESIMENFPHKTLDLILDTLRNPPTIYDKGNVAQSWRLNPDTVKAWVNAKAIEREEQRLKAEARENASKPIEVKPLSPETQQKINEFLNSLASASVREVPKVSGAELKRIELEDNARVERPVYRPEVSPEEYLAQKERLKEAISKRGLDKCDFRDLKRFDIQGQPVRARTLEEAHEIYIEVYV